MPAGAADRWGWRPADDHNVFPIRGLQVDGRFLTKKLTLAHMSDEQFAALFNELQERGDKEKLKGDAPASIAIDIAPTRKKANDNRQFEK